MIEIEAKPEEPIWGEQQSPEEEATGPVTVAHIATTYRCYPGETITFYTRVEVWEDLSDLKLSIALPDEITLEDYTSEQAQEGLRAHFETGESGTYLVWALAQELPAGTRYDFRTEATVTAVLWDITLESQAVVTAPDEIMAEETVLVLVRAKGKYLRYLPAIYEQDDLMGRFVMLFESFWTPIETQINNGHYYLDPRLTPPNFLPWLASWLDLDLDERWPKAQQRQLVRWAIALHRSRGTKWGLLKYLEIYTGQQAQILEHRSANFVLGGVTRLGSGIALGRKNQPHTFTVKLQLPPIAVDDEQERARQEQIRRRTIETIIEMQKPAHTVYTLDLEIISPDALADAVDSQPRETDKEADEISAQAAIWFKLEDEESSSAKQKKGKGTKRKGRKR